MTHTPSGATPTVQLTRRARIGQRMLAGLGGFLALLAIGELADRCHQPLLIGSFGATCVLLFGFPKVSFSRARNVIGGHLLCSCTGLACLALFGPGTLPMAAAVGFSITLMLACDLTHPPAGGNSIIIFMTQPGWLFALTPTLAGAVMLVLIAGLYGWLISRVSTLASQR